MPDVAQLEATTVFRFAPIKEKVDPYGTKLPSKCEIDKMHAAFKKKAALLLKDAEHDPLGKSDIEDHLQHEIDAAYQLATRYKALADAITSELLTHMTNAEQSELATHLNQRFAEAMECREVARKVAREMDWDVNGIQGLGDDGKAGFIHQDSPQVSPHGSPTKLATEIALP